jgi:hypothetical protein
VGSEVVGETDGDKVGSEVAGDIVGSDVVGDIDGEVVGSEVAGEVVGTEVVGALDGAGVGANVKLQHVQGQTSRTSASCKQGLCALPLPADVAIA